MPFLFVVLYGLFSGFFDVLPVSSFAHQSILQSIFGIKEPLHLYKFLIHIASLGALIFASMPTITALLREQRLSTLPRRKMQGDRKLTYELHFVKTAIAIITLSSALILVLADLSPGLLAIGILCILNGIVVLVPEYLPYGNKTAKHVSRLDAMIFGLLGGLGVIPGISRTASLLCYSNLRGVDRSKSCNWLIFATISSVAVLSLFDVFGMITVGIGQITFPLFLSFVFGAVLSFISTFAGVTLLRFLSANVGFTGFGYYSIGVGLLAFFLYLTV